MRRKNFEVALVGRFGGCPLCGNKYMVELGSCLAAYNHFYQLLERVAARLEVAVEVE